MNNRNRRLAEHTRDIKARQKKAAYEVGEILDQLDEGQLVSLHNYVASENGYEEIFDMYDFDDLLDGKTPTEIANMTHFGEYSPTADYMTFDGYGNFKSVSNYELRGEVEDLLTGVADEIEAIREWADDQGENIDFGDDEDGEDGDYYAKRRQRPVANRPVIRSSRPIARQQIRRSIGR